MVYVTYKQLSLSAKVKPFKTKIQCMVLLMVMIIIIKLYSNNNFNRKYLAIFDVNGTVYHNITSIVKPTRCTSVSNLF